MGSRRGAWKGTGVLQSAPPAPCTCRPSCTPLATPSCSQLLQSAMHCSCALVSPSWLGKSPRIEHLMHASSDQAACCAPAVHADEVHIWMNCKSLHVNADPSRRHPLLRAPLPPSGTCVDVPAALYEACLGELVFFHAVPVPGCLEKLAARPIGAD